MLDDSKVPPPGRGSTWTLITFLTVFIAILATVYCYVFPRLYGERVSPGARIEIYAMADEPSSGSREMKLTDGAPCFLLGSPLMSALDFSVFRGDGLQNPPRLTLYFSDSGRQKIPSEAALEKIPAGVLLPNGTVAATSASDWGKDRVTLLLPGVSADDANEIFARLTN